MIAGERMCKQKLLFEEKVHLNFILPEQDDLINSFEIDDFI